MTKKRNYEREYSLYQGKPEQIKNRAARNAARAKLVKAGKLHKGDGKDAAHDTALSKGGDKGAVHVESKSANRSFARNPDNSMKSEASKKERRPKKR
jgi:hypothetical protein